MRNTACPLSSIDSYWGAATAAVQASQVPTVAGARSLSTEGMVWPALLYVVVADAWFEQFGDV